MLTTDLALRFDPEYEKVSRRFLENPDEFALAFAKAWYKLLHRDMGPISRYLGPWVAEPQLWQDPVPAVDHELVGDADVAALKSEGPRLRALASRSCHDRLGFGGQLPRAPTSAAAPTARASGSSRRRTGRSTSRPSSAHRAGAGPAGVQRAGSGGTQISLADLIVLGGVAAVEKAARDAGVDVTVPFRPGRTDASQEETDVESFAVLEPRADGFRSYLRAGEKLAARDAAARPRLHARPERARDDGARRRPAGPRRERRRVARTASSPTGRAR